MDRTIASTSSSAKNFFIFFSSFEISFTHVYIKRLNIPSRINTDTLYSVRPRMSNVFDVFIIFYNFRYFQSPKLFKKTKTAGFFAIRRFFLLFFTQEQAISAGICSECLF